MKFSDFQVEENRTGLQIFYWKYFSVNILLKIFFRKRLEKNISIKKKHINSFFFFKADDFNMIILLITL